MLTEIEIKILEKGLGYAPIQNKINEPELKQDFEEFYRKMRLNGISVMNLLLNVVLSLYLIPNLRGNHLPAVLV